jgi:hypothetical protein
MDVAGVCMLYDEITITIVVLKFSFGYGWEIFPFLALRRMSMKLNLLFIVMDLFTILAYPFVFMHSKLFQFSKARNVFVASSIKRAVDGS